MTKCAMLMAEAVNQTPRYEALKDYLHNQGKPVEFTYHSPTIEDFLSSLPNILEEHEAVRVGAPFGEIVLRYFKKQSINMLSLKAADSIVKEQGEWWPRSALYFGLLKILNLRQAKLELDGSVLVVGAGAAARTIVGVVAKLGFKQISITNKFNDQAFALIGELKRNYFDLKLEFVPQDQLVMLPGTNSVVINTTPAVESNDLLNELYYFNFLRPSGLVIDLNVIPSQSHLIKEAEQIGKTVVNGIEVAAAADLCWCDWALATHLDLADYTNFLFSKLQA